MKISCERFTDVPRIFFKFEFFARSFGYYVTLKGGDLGFDMLHLINFSDLFDEICYGGEEGMSKMAIFSVM